MNATQVLIFVPSYEYGQKLYKCMISITEFMDISKIYLCDDRFPIQREIRKLTENLPNVPQIIIGTSQRIRDLIIDRRITLSEIRLIFLNHLDKFTSVFDRHAISEIFNYDELRFTDRKSY
jgi:hypothetical protein